MPLRRLLPPLVAAALATGTLAACGGGSDGDAPGGDDATAAALIKSTFGTQKAVTSGRVAAKLRIDTVGLQALSGPVAFDIDGRFDQGSGKKVPDLDIGLKIAAAGNDASIGVISTGGAAYIGIAGQAFKLDSAAYKRLTASFAKQTGSASGPLSLVGIDPRRWLEDAKVVGQATVGGVPVTEVAGRIDVEKLLTELQGAGAALQGATGGTTTTPAFTDDQRKQIADAVEQADVTVWTGKADKLLRRLVVKVGFEIPEDARQDLGGLERGTFSLDLTLTGLNEPQTVTAPENAQKLGDLTAQLQGLAGAAAGGAGTGTSTTPQGGAAGDIAPSPEASQKYLDCIDAAGTDLAKVQKCAPLLTG